MGEKILLMNKSSRVFKVSSGKFYPDTVKEFDEKEAIGLMAYTNEIVRVDSTTSGKVGDTISALRIEIAQLKSENKSLKEQIGSQEEKTGKGKKSK